MSTLTTGTSVKNKAQLYLSVVCLIVLFDVAASFASRWLRFDYTSLAWVSLCLYAVCGYLGFAYRRLLGGALAGLMAGVADSTIGWALSAAIQPYMRVEQHRPTIVLVSITIVIVSLEGAFFGFIGALVRWSISRLQEKS
jgi:hypothetical protein